MVDVPRQRHSEAGAQPRVVLLGASNLARCISTVVETAQRTFDGPLAVYATPGHGRSYGVSSMLLGRRLPGIVSCGLWDDLRRGPPSPTVALLTDIGNDLMYNIPVAQIVGWVETCLDRLQAAEARVVMTLLPVANLKTLSPGRYTVFRNLFYPANRSDLAAMRRQAVELNEQVHRLGAGRGVSLVAPCREWYGIDPIHLRRSCWPAAWQAILAPWHADSRPTRPANGSLRRWFFLRTLRPQVRDLFGVTQRQRQPAGRLPDGTSIALY